MLKIFRQIRQKLLFENITHFNEGNLKKYLIYALGEIILVVIGILIALQINNWNQRRIDNKNEVIYLKGLKEEFELSKLKLIELRSVNETNYNGSVKILEAIHNKNQGPTEVEFSKMLFETFSDDIAFNPNNSLLTEMINSGHLKQLKNAQLRKLLTNWISTLDDVAKQEVELSNQRVKVLDMFRSNNTSLSLVFQSAGMYEELGITHNRDDMSNLNLLNTKAFENNVLMFMFTSYATENAHFKPLMQDLEAIINLINQELQS